MAVGLIRSLQQELADAVGYEATTVRAQTTAGGMTEQQLEAVERRYGRNPQLPPDVHVAAAVSPEMTDDMFDQLAGQYEANGFEPLWGDRLTGNQLRYMLATPEQQAQIGHVVDSMARVRQPQSLVDRLLNSGVPDRVRQTVSAGQSAFGAAASADPTGTLAGLGSTASTVSSGLSKIDDGVRAGMGTPVGSAVRGFTRNVMPALDAPPQLAQAAYRTGIMGLRDAAQGDLMGGLEAAAELGLAFQGRPGEVWAQTDYAQTVQYRTEQARGALNAVLGREFEIANDTGDGFFAADESTVVQRRRAAERVPGVLPNGQTITIGRATATGFGFDPDGTSYNVMSGLLDGAVMIGAPGVEGGLARSLNSGRRAVQRGLGGLADDALLTGLNRTVDVDAARSWLNSAESENLINYLARTEGEQGFVDVWNASRGTLEPDAVRRIVDAGTPEDVRFALEQAILEGNMPAFRNQAGRAITRTTGALGDFDFLRSSGLRRMRGLVPENVVHLQDGHRSVEFTFDFARNVKADNDTIARWVSQMGRASNEFERYEALTSMLGETAVRLSDGGIPAERARELTRMFNAEDELARLSLDDMLLGRPDWSTYMMDVGDARLPAMHLMSQAATTLRVPDFRDLRRATSWARPLWEMSADPSAAARFTRALGSGWQNMFDGLMMYQTRWKQARLLRLGYPLRTWMTEEPARRLVDGRTGFSHPGGVFAALLERDIRVGDDLDDMLRQVRQIPGLEGLDDAAAFDQAMLRGVRPQRGVRDAVTGEALEAVEGVKIDERLGGLVNEARTGTRQGQYVRYFRGENDVMYRQAWRDEVMTLGADEVAQRVARYGVDETFDFLMGDGQTMWARLQSFNPTLSDPLSLDRYLKMVGDKVAALTGGSDELLSAVRSGRWNDAIDLAELSARGVGPEAVVGRAVLQADEMKALDRGVNTFFDVLVTRPTNELLRMPTFRESYERILVELAPLMKEPDEALTMARRANVSAESMATIEATARGEGLLDLQRIDALAKAGALNDVRRLHFDATRQTQFFDTMRLMAPFGEAWREVVVSWSKLIASDPFTPTRFAGQTARGAASDDFGNTYFEMVGVDDKEDQGFFYTNEYGEKVFYYPGSRQFMQWYTSRASVDAGPIDVPIPWQSNGTGGAPVDLEGSLTGLNIAGEVLPGLGPVSGLAADHVLPSGTSWDGVRSALFPFGTPPSLLNADNFLPAWMATMLRGDGEMTQAEARVYGNTRLRVMRYLYSTGDYMDGQEGFNRLLADSDQITPMAFVARGLIQFSAPSSPQMSHNMIEADGSLADMSVMVDAYRRLQEEDPSMALERFLAEYGEGVLLATQGGTTSRYPGGTPLEGASYNWVRDNPSVETEHRELYGFFAPLGEGSDFSQEAYVRSLERGDRVVLTAEEQLMLANHRRGTLEYRRFSEAVPPNERSEEQRLFLNNLRRELMLKYPGYDNVEGIAGRAPAYQLIDRGHVDRALDNPILMRTNAGQALAEYWRFRESVLAQAEANGVTVGSEQGWRTSGEGEPYREALRAAGNELVRQEPEFARMWDLFLSQEFAREDE